MCSLPKGTYTTLVHLHRCFHLICLIRPRLRSVWVRTSGAYLTSRLLSCYVAFVLQMQKATYIFLFQCQGHFAAPELNSCIICSLFKQLCTSSCLCVPVAFAIWLTFGSQCSTNISPPPPTLTRRHHSEGVLSFFSSSSSWTVMTKWIHTLPWALFHTL